MNPEEQGATNRFGIEDVVARGLCIGCGACSVITNGAVRVQVSLLGLYQADLEGVSAEARAKASRVCPMSNDAANEDLIAAGSFKHLRHDDHIGYYAQTFAGSTSDKATILESSSGGMTTQFLSQALKDGIVDGVIHVGRTVGEVGLDYVISYSVEELFTRRKSQYTSTTLAHVLDAVSGDGQKYALVGVPCFIKAARLLVSEEPALEEQLTLFVGLVCGHLKSQFFAQSLAWQAGIEPARFKTLDFRVKNARSSAADYDYEATSTDGTITRKKTRSAIDGSWAYGAFSPEACNYCDDIFAETADIVFGDAWLPEYESDWRGTNVVITRSEDAIGILERSAENGVVGLEHLAIDRVVASQSGNFRHRRVGLAVRLMDDRRSGRKFPQKRITPSYSGTSLRRRLLIRQRAHMSRLSLATFRIALERNDLIFYTRPMQREIIRYTFVDAWSKSFARGIKFTIKFLLGR